MSKPKNINHINREFKKILRTLCSIEHPELISYIDTVEIVQTIDDASGVRTWVLQSNFPEDDKAWLSQAWAHYRGVSNYGQKYYYTSRSVILENDD